MPYNITSKETEQKERQKNRMPVEKKLRLAQSIREENLGNRMKIRQREKFLYGKESMPPLWDKETSFRPDYPIREGEGDGKASTETVNTFKVRMAAAVFLFVLFLLCDAGEYNVFGYSMNDICGIISEDYFQIYDGGQNAEELPQLSDLLHLDL